jgi:hypothetical protein
MSGNEAYVLEISTVDPATQTFTMRTQNLSYTKLMLIIEAQTIRPDPSYPDSRTVAQTEASIVSSTGWKSIRSRIEGFGLSNLKTSTLRVINSLFFVDLLWR